MKTGFVHIGMTLLCVLSTCYFVPQHYWPPVIAGVVISNITGWLFERVATYYGH